MNENTWPFILICGGLLVFLLAVSFFSQRYSLNNIKSKTVGDGQHGTARWATPKEIRSTYHIVPFRPRRWRKGIDLPQEQGVILGSMGGAKKKRPDRTARLPDKVLEKLRRPATPRRERKRKKSEKKRSRVKDFIEEQQDIRALVDSDDIHCLMIGASGVGKTAYFLYPNLEYACACSMSFLALDTKGDLARNYGKIASHYYKYRVSVIDLRNPTRSDGFSFLTLVNHYMDKARKAPNDLASKAKAEKYAKILAKTIINPEGDASQYGENAFFYDSAEGLLTAIVLLLAEFMPPKEGEPEKRHIVSAFKLVQDLLAPPKNSRSKNGFQPLMDLLPSDHKSRWLAGAALNSSDQSMASVMSTVLSRLNAFLDTELEQVICYDSPINAEMFASEKCAMYYAKGTHTPLLDRDIFNKVQALLEKRQKQFNQTESLNVYPLTSRIRCAECGSIYRRKIRNGVPKWVCKNHLEDSKLCPSNYFSEARIYDALASMINKLRFGEEDILGQVISKLEVATLEHKRNNKAAGTVSQSIAEINAKILMLDQLRAKGYLAPEVHQAQTIELRSQLGKLKSERSDLFETRILGMLEDVKKLRTLLQEVEAPLETINEQLLLDVVKELVITKKGEMSVTVLGNLTFQELL